MKRSAGRVYLVGAGPGRPDLLTLRGVDCLARADAVVLDALVDRRVLAHCRPGVDVREAGKRGHGKALMGQPDINRLLVRRAKSGKTVVRLKGGDPFVFGRGGEEAVALSRARVSFEVVPGVSSVNAVPALAGIPLTHRALASTVTIVTGHEGKANAYLRESARDRTDRRAPAVDWDRLPREGTLVILMGLARLPEILGRLRRAGWPTSTPAAAIQWGSWPDQRTVRGTLGVLAQRVRAARLGAPALVVLGRVVDLAPLLRDRDRPPLAGRRVLVTRAADAAGPLSTLLRDLGATVIECPAIAIDPLPLTPRARYWRDHPEVFDGLLVTSANAARQLALLRGGRPWPGVPAYAVGPKTAEALRDAGIPVAGVAGAYNAGALSRALGRTSPGRRYLFPRAEEGRDTLVRALERSGARVFLWPLYRTRRLPPSPAVRRALREGRIDAVTFTSSSTVDALLSGFTARERASIFSKTAAASIGPLTSRTLRRFGVRPRVTAPRATVASLADALGKAFAP